MICLELTSEGEGTSLQYPEVLSGIQAQMDPCTHSSGSVSNNFPFVEG